jgi:hypothetical protein
MSSFYDQDLQLFHHFNQGIQNQTNKSSSTCEISYLLVNYTIL